MKIIFLKIYSSFFFIIKNIGRVLITFLYEFYKAIHFLFTFSAGYVFIKNKIKFRNIAISKIKRYYIRLKCCQDKKNTCFNAVVTMDTYLKLLIMLIQIPE